MALSFSISSLFFIHKKALKDQGIVKYSIMYDISYVIVSFSMFPLVALGYLLIDYKYTELYGEYLARSMREKNE